MGRRDTRSRNFRRLNVETRTFALRIAVIDSTPRVMGVHNMDMFIIIECEWFEVRWNPQSVDLAIIC